ncbi:hypothetical protein ACTMU2_15770 [Cupriavidus basilensis]
MIAPATQIAITLKTHGWHSCARKNFYVRLSGTKTTQLSASFGKDNPGITPPIDGMVVRVRRTVDRRQQPVSRLEY